MVEEAKSKKPVVKLKRIPAKAPKRGPIGDDELRLLAPPYELQWTSYVFSQAYTLYQKVFTAVGQNMGLTIPQFLILYALLLSERPLGCTELSRLLPIELQSVTAVLDRLEQRKLVVRQRSPDDRRAVKVSLTQAGHDLLRDHIPMMKCLLERTIGTLSLEERHSLAAISQKLSRAAVVLLRANPEHIHEMIELFTQRLARLEKSG